MVFVHLSDPTKQQHEIANLKKAIHSNKDMFVLFHWKICGPCKQTKPEWDKLYNDSYLKKDKTIVVADIENDCLASLKDTLDTSFIKGYPTIVHLKGDKVVDKFDDYISKNPPPDHKLTLDMFLKWMKPLLPGKVIQGGSSASRSASKSASRKRKSKNKRTRSKSKRSKQRKTKQNK